MPVEDMAGVTAGAMADTAGMLLKDMLPQVMIAGLWTLVPAFFLAGPFAASPRDVAILAFMGSVQLGVGCLLATAASRSLSATEIGLLALLEPIIGPMWVWLLMGEDPGGNALVGGAIVLGAVIANEAFAAWRGRDPVPAAGSALDRAERVAREVNADLVLGTDPDADRLGVLAADGRGGFRYITGNEIAYLATWFKLDQLSKQGRMPESPVVITTIGASALTELSPVSSPTRSGPWRSTRSLYFWFDSALIGVV